MIAITAGRSCTCVTALSTRGGITRYTWNPELDDQDFLLYDATCVDDDLKEKYIVDGIGVYLNTRDVNRIEFVNSK